MNREHDLSQRFPRASASFLALNAPKSPAVDPVAAGVLGHQSQPVQRKEVLRDEEAPHPGPDRVAVIITRCSSGSLDRDNLHSATKALLDALRYRGLIIGDREQDIELICLQRKVKRKERGTLVEIIPLP